jgi:hypothetical protein
MEGKKEVNGRTEGRNGRKGPHLTRKRGQGRK